MLKVEIERIVARELGDLDDLYRTRIAHREAEGKFPRGKPLFKGAAQKVGIFIVLVHPCLPEWGLFR